MRIIAIVAIAALLMLIVSGTALAATGSQGDQYSDSVNGGPHSVGDPSRSTLPSTGVGMPLLLVSGLFSIGVASRLVTKKSL